MFKTCEWLISTFTDMLCECCFNKKCKRKGDRNPTVCFLSKEIQGQSAQFTKKGILRVSGRGPWGPGISANKQASWKSHITPALGGKVWETLRKSREVSVHCEQTQWGISALIQTPWKRYYNGWEETLEIRKGDTENLCDGTKVTQ